MEAEKESFNYTYSSEQQEEVRAILEKYVPKESNKIEQLRALDRQSAKRGTILSIITGVLGTLFLGVGMTCTMVWQAYFIPGIFIGLAGMAGIAAAYPLYRRITQRQREKIAAQILQLGRELLK